MCKASPFALALIWLLPNFCEAVEIKNVRAAYGAAGATRTDNKLLPGDFICLVFNIDGLKVDKKTMQAKYRIAYDLMDGRGSIESKGTEQEFLLGLGGNTAPGVVVVPIPLKQSPGKYKIKLTATDNNAKKTGTYEFPLEVTPPEFGIVAVLAPAVGIPGQPYKADYHFVNIALDGKKKPKVEIVISVLDDSGKPLGPPAKRSYPRDLPSDTDLEKLNFVAEWYPLIPNRSGQFTIVIDAHDRIANKKTQLRLPLTVLDLGKLGSGVSAGAGGDR
jgi:hypothetical protein